MNYVPSSLVVMHHGFMRAGSVTTALALRPIPVAIVVGWAVLVLALTAAVVHPLIAYDAWMYHLPFAARLWDIPGIDRFGMDSVTAERWLGYPKAWHWLKGLGLSMTGSLRGTVLPQVILFAGFLWYLHYEHRIAIHWLVLGLFASPMLLVHSQATYLDLPTGICLAWGLIAFLDAVEGARGESGRIPRLPAFVALITIGLAGNIKYQGLIGAILVVFIIFLAIIFECRLVFIRKIQLITISMVSLTLSCASAIWNFYHFAHPLYPMEITVLGHLLLHGPESPGMDANPPSYLLAGAHEIQLPVPINYVLSLTELDWTLRGVAPWYNIDSVTGKTPRRGDPSRTGGIGQLFVFFHLTLLAWQVAQWRSLHDQHQRRLIMACCILLALLAIVPRSHELRYWLAGPILLLFVNIRYLNYIGWPKMARWSIFVLFSLGFANSILSPRSELLARPAITPEKLRMEIPQDIRQALAHGEYFCDPGNELLFRFAWAMPEYGPLLSRNAADCR